MSVNYNNNGTLEKIAGRTVDEDHIGEVYTSSEVTVANQQWTTTQINFSTPVPAGKYLVGLRGINTTSTPKFLISSYGHSMYLSVTSWSGIGESISAQVLTINAPTGSLSPQFATQDGTSMKVTLKLIRLK